MIQHREAVGEMDRLVHAKQCNPGAETDPRRQRKRFRDQQVGRRRILPFLREMLAEPSFPEAEPIGRD